MCDMFMFLTVKIKKLSYNVKCIFPTVDIVAQTNDKQEKKIPQDSGK